jgi:S-adenosylmethionine:tRNA ribosyltransferase-isomerase
MNLEAEVVDNSSISGRILKFSTYIKEDDFLKILKDNASVYLPDYIKREPEENDKIWTKSIYAKNFGSVTNIISGLHFYDDLLLNLKLKGVFFETLNYTINNFYSNRFESKTVFDCNKAIDICKMDLNLIYKINEAKGKAKKICAVGYSTALGLENRYSSSLGRLCDDNFFSNIVTKVTLSNNDFYVCDAILTNFHEEGSMFLVVDVAFAGMDLLQKAYKSAFDNGYKFCMYGDSLLII